MLEERENQGRSVHPGPHFRQAPHARLGGPEAPTGVSPSPQGARAGPAHPPGASLAQARPGPALDVIQQVTGGPAFSRSRSLSGVLGSGRPRASWARITPVSHPQTGARQDPLGTFSWVPSPCSKPGPPGHLLAGDPRPRAHDPF